jgi:adenylate kinase
VSEKTSLGELAASYIQRGALVPDGVILDLVADRVKQKDCATGFLLDGFPRTIAQADGLERILQASGLKLDRVLSVRVPLPVIVERLSGRRTCKACGTMYHVTFDPPKKAGICDKCGGVLYQREDDREETVAARLTVYETQTSPLADYYRAKGLLRDIDGVGSVDEINRRVIAALGDEAK